MMFCNSLSSKHDLIFSCVYINIGIYSNYYAKIFFILQAFIENKVQSSIS